VSDDLRIDLSLARAAGLTLRSANDASTPRFDAAAPGCASDPLFSPLALLLSRFLPSLSTPTPDRQRCMQYSASSPAQPRR